MGVFAYRRDAEGTEKTGSGIESKSAGQVGSLPYVERIFTPRFLCELSVSAVDSGYGK
jgi:hypothetical protein